MAVNYNPVPSVEPQVNAAPSQTERANPNSFGAQVSGQLEKTGDEAFALAQKQQGMINETLSTNAETQYMMKLGTMTGQYKSLSGLDAVSALPKYTEDVANLRQQYRSQLPPAAAHSFDMLALRHEGYAIQDANVYSANQIKKADYESSATGIAASVANAGSPDVANNDTRFGESLGDIRAHTARQFNDSAGIVQNEDGTANFADTPSGEAAKQDFQQRIDQSIGAAWQNRFKTLADQNTLGAWQKYQESKDSIPSQTKVALDAYFYPRVREAQAKQSFSDVMATAREGYSQEYADSGSSTSSNSYNLGNVKTASGAAKGTADFVNPATPVDGAILAVNTLRNIKYDGKTISQIGPIWTGESKDKSDAWVANVSKTSGIDPNAPINLDDPATLGKLLKGISVAEKPIKDRALFTDDIISQGVQASLAGKSAVTASSQPGSIPPPSDADYYRKNYASILDSAKQKAEALHPGDIAYSDTVRVKTEQYMNDRIRQQEMAYKVDNDTIYKAMNGDLSKGQKPTSIAALEAISPEVRAAWGSVMTNSPHVAMAIQNNFLTANSKETDKDTKEYGDKYLDLYHQIHPKAGESPSITDSTQLYDYVGNGLTTAGMNQLQKELQSNDPTKQFKTDTYKAIEGKISKKDPMTGLEDPNGSMQAVKAHYAMDKYYEDQKSKGVTDDELLDPDNKKWVGNVGLSYKRSDAQMAADIRSANTSNSAVKQLSADIESGKYPDKLKAIQQAYHSGKLTKQQAVQMASTYKVIQGNQTSAVPSGTSVPTPED